MGGMPKWGAVDLYFVYVMNKFCNKYPYHGASARPLTSFNPIRHPEPPPKITKILLQFSRFRCGLFPFDVVHLMSSHLISCHTFLSFFLSVPHGAPPAEGRRNAGRKEGREEGREDPIRGYL